MSELNRRGFLEGMAALGTSAWLPGCASTDGGGTVPGRRIDVHHLLSRPAILRRSSKWGRATRSGRCKCRLMTWIKAASKRRCCR